MASSATLINSTSTNVNTNLNTVSSNQRTGDNCVSNSLSDSTNSINIQNFNITGLTDHSTRLKTTLPDINNNNSNAMTQSGHNNCNATASNLNSNNLNANNSTSNDLSNNFISNNLEMVKVKQSNSLSNSPQDYHPIKKASEGVISCKSYVDTNIYSENAMDIKVIDSDCVIYFYCSDVILAIEDHFKKSLNTNIFTKYKDSNNQKSLPMNQRDLPPSFWNCNYFNDQQQKQQSHNYQQSQQNLVTDHSHHYLPLIEPSAPTSSLQPLLQLETLSQLTHLQNHTQNISNSTAANSTMNNFSANQHPMQNSSLINNPINNLSFAHHLHNSQSTVDNFGTLDHQQISNAQSTTSTGFQPTLNQQSNDITSQPQFLHHLLHQQNNHNPFQYTQNTVIQTSTDHPNNFQQHSSLTTHYHNGSDISNNWSPHSVFIPLASPASSSSCSSNAENNVNRSNKLTNLSNGSSLSKQYDHVTKQTARFALNSSVLLQSNSTGTSPNRSPLSTNTSSPAQTSHNSSTLSPVGFHPSNSTYQFTNLEKQRNSLFPNLTSNFCNNLQNYSAQSNNSNESTNFSSNNTASSPISTSSNSTVSTTLATLTSSTLTKSFTHFAHQPTADHWNNSNHSVAHQPYLAFHSAAHNLANYHPSTTPNTSSDKSGNNASNCNQYNSLLLAGTTGSVNTNSNQSANYLKTTATNSLQHSIAHSSVPNHISNYNYYHLNSLNQINSLTNSSAETAPTPINFRHHYHHHNASNYNGYNYNYGLAAMTGFDNQVTTEGTTKEIQYWF